MVSNIFNYKNVLQDLKINDFKSKPPDWYHTSSYNSAGHGIILRDVLSTGPKYCEPKSINWTHNFLMDFTVDHARQWEKNVKEKT